MHINPPCSCGVKEVEGIEEVMRAAEEKKMLPRREKMMLRRKKMALRRKEMMVVMMLRREKRMCDGNGEEQRHEKMNVRRVDKSHGVRLGFF